MHWPQESLLWHEVVYSPQAAKDRRLMKSWQTPSPTSLLLSPHKRDSSSITRETELLHCKCVPREISKPTCPQSHLYLGMYKWVPWLPKKLLLKALVLKKGCKRKEKASFVWDIFAWPFREQETPKYHTHIFRKLTLPRTSSRAISQHKDCRLGNLQSMHLSCTVPCKSQIFILFLHGALAAVAFPHLF